MESPETESEFRSKARTLARTAWAVAGFAAWLAHEESNVLAEFGEQHVRDAASALGLHPTPQRFTTSEPKGDLS